MNEDVLALFRELADRSAAERETYYRRHGTPAAVRAEVESLLRYDGGAFPSAPIHGRPFTKVSSPGRARRPCPAATTRGQRRILQTPRLIHQRAFCRQFRFPPGTMLAERYLIVNLVGRGGMGEVYRATDLKLKQAVALKFLPESAARDPRLVARLHTEVRLARQISHPNVCRVYDIDEVSGAPFISMEYIDGEDLAALLRRIGRLPHDKAVEIARRLCAGLAAAHDKGVVHRDLKPGNVMIDSHGQVFITDFGLAASARELDAHTVAPRHARVHGAGAARRARSHRAKRPLLARPRPLRDVHRQGAIHGTSDAHGSPSPYR